MKTVKKIGITSGGMVSAAASAEASMARQEARDLIRGIPEGHPLRNDAEKQQALLGDLSGLPPGHPMLIELQAAKERYEQRQAQKEKEQNHTAEMRKAKQILDDKAKREARRKEDEQNEAMMAAAKKVDTALTEMLVEVKKLWGMVAESEEILNIDPISRTKIGKLKRLLFASERGLSECRITKVRA